MSIWVALAVAAGVGWLSAAVSRSRGARRLLAVGSVMLGAALMVFSYNDARRAALGVAPLADSELESLGRRHVSCSRPEWSCEQLRQDDETTHIPFRCGGPVPITAAFSTPVDCPPRVELLSGYLVDMNEAGWGDAQWVLRVGRSHRKFPGPLTWMGIGFVALGLAIPGMIRWAARRLAAANAS